MTNHNNKAWLIDFILLAAIWGASFMFMRVASHEMGAFASAGLRVCIAAVFLVPLLLQVALLLAQLCAALRRIHRFAVAKTRSCRHCDPSRNFAAFRGWVSRV